jgi:hypothetical protein
MLTTDEAEGYADLGMWIDAWNALRALPENEPFTPLARRIALRCAGPLKQWETGDLLAHELSEGCPEDRIAVATFRHFQAQMYVRVGNNLAASDAIEDALKVWPDYREFLAQHPIPIPWA